MQEKVELERAFETDEPDFEFLGALEDVTYGWGTYVYDVSWGDFEE
ncbi:hypothetical protein [Jidongwangia harbinensis]|nr:hypothetical protein [Jidongwangia harbinensis]MCA2211686.1 hypothetical protein [Jidongwangia harbinensis]